jgi:hypothetical protein
MSIKSTTGDHIDPARARATVPGPKPKADQKAQDWHRALIVVAGFFVLAALGFVLATTTDFPMLSPTTNAMIGGELHTAAVISYSTDKKECREQVFDNKTGQMTKPEPCGLRALNSTGASASSYSVNRLDAIKKAFSNR